MDARVETVGSTADRRAMEWRYRGEWVVLTGLIATWTSAGALIVDFWLQREDLVFVDRVQYLNVFAAALLAGWTMVSGGSWSVIAVRHRIGASGYRSVLAGTVAAVGLVVLVAWICGEVGRARRWPVGVAVVTQGCVIWWWRRSVRRSVTEDVSPVKPYWLAGTLIAAFIGSTAATSVYRMPDVYPISNYPMYSTAWPGDLREERVEYLGTRADGSQVTLQRPVHNNTSVALVHADDIDAVTTLADVAASTRSDISYVEVVHRVFRVVPHPEPAGVELVEERVFTTVMVEPEP